MSLKGKVALVTGARQGLGKSISLGMAEAGADLVVCDRVTDDGKLDETAKEIEALGCQALTMGGDITVEEDVNNIVDKSIEKFGKIDVLVNNAGLFPQTALSAVAPDTVRQSRRYFPLLQSCPAAHAREEERHDY
jgi:3-oxoacyl-[acyl-carrier protein] reductase